MRVNPEVEAACTVRARLVRPQQLVRHGISAVHAPSSGHFTALSAGAGPVPAPSRADWRAVRFPIASFIRPYDDPAIIAGQGTVALEMLEDAPDLEMLVVPIGGGGLISGIATAAKALRGDIRVFGVESKSCRAMHQRLHGQPVEVGGDTIAEDLAVREFGQLTLEIVPRLVEEVLIVEEATIERAVVALIEIERTVAEGAGAAGLAALLEHPAAFRGRRVGIPLCGGNIDARALAAVLMRGLVRDGQLVRLRVTMPDVSGRLANVATVIGEAGGNIVEVQHQRLFGTASVKSPEVEFLIETRDQAHSAAIVAALEAKGVREPNDTIGIASALQGPQSQARATSPKPPRLPRRATTFRTSLAISEASLSVWCLASTCWSAYCGYPREPRWRRYRNKPPGQPMGVTPKWLSTIFVRRFVRVAGLCGLTRFGPRLHGRVVIS